MNNSIALKLKHDISLTKVITYLDENGALSVKEESLDFVEGETIQDVSDVVPRNNEQNTVNIKLKDGSVIIQVPTSCYDGTVRLNISEKNIPDGFKKTRPCGGCGG